MRTKVFSCLAACSVFAAVVVETGIDVAWAASVSGRSSDFDDDGDVDLTDFGQFAACFNISTVFGVRAHSLWGQSAFSW